MFLQMYYFVVFLYFDIKISLLLLQRKYFFTITFTTITKRNTSPLAPNGIYLIIQVVSVLFAKQQTRLCQARCVSLIVTVVKLKGSYKVWQSK